MEAESDLGADSPLSPSAPVSPSSSGNATIGTVTRPAADIVFKVDEVLDCRYLGNRVVLKHPGRDSLNVEIETLTEAIAAGVLKIKTAIGDDTKTGVAPNLAADITSTGSTQKQSARDVTGQGVSWVEVSTVQSGLIVRVRMSAMKT